MLIDSRQTKTQKKKNLKGNITKCVLILTVEENE